MTQRTKLELAINQQTEITLLFDEPITGRSQYGEYFMYAVAIGEAEHSFFAPAEVHSELKSLRKGDSAIITKLAAQRGSKLVTTYDVQVIGKEVKQPAANAVAQNQEEEISARDILLSDDAPLHDSFFDIMLRSYRDGLEISKELNGMADPEKIAVTLFIARSKQAHF